MDSPESEGVIRFQKDIPVRHEVDVFVAGGGPAGVATSVAAARQGKRVFLAEANTCLGGLGTAGLVPNFCRFGDGINFLAAGVGKEVLTRFREMDGTGPRDDKTNEVPDVVPIRVEVLKRLYDSLLLESGAAFTFNTHLIDVETHDGAVTAAILAGKSGLFAVKAGIYIDCTGDGDLCAWAGAPFEKGDKDGQLMAGTLCSLWANVDFRATAASGLNQRDGLKDAFKDGVFSRNDLHLPGMVQNSRHVGGGNIGHTFDVDGTDETSLTKAILCGRKQMPEYERYYKQYLKGYEQMELVATGSMLGVRETRRIVGQYVLCLEDFKNRAVFDDEIGRYSWPVDIHPSGTDEAAYARFLEEFHNLAYGPGESYGVPYRSLIPQELTNVLVAGRCISSDRYMQSSIRVMPGCFITGQAVGVAAAVAIDHNTDTRGVPVKELQRRLLDMGAYLPNANV